MKVRYKSKDGAYESTAYLDEDPYVGPLVTKVTGVDKHTDEPVVLVATTHGWQEVD